MNGPNNKNGSYEISYINNSEDLVAFKKKRLNEFGWDEDEDDDSD